jgi:hypothetical protein
VHSRSTLISAVLISLAVCPTLRAAPLHKLKAEKSDWSGKLATALIANREAQSASLFQICGQSNFRALATALYDARDHISRSKSEYETDAEFLAAKQAAEQAINSDGRFVVCQKLKDNKWAPFSYDANREVFVGEFRTEQTVERYSQRVGTYIGRTAYGATAKVNKVAGAEFDITMEFPTPDGECREYGAPPGCRIIRTGEPAGCPRTDSNTFRYEVAIPRSDAAALKAEGYLVFVGRLKYPFVKWGYSPTFASLDQPLDMRIDIFDVAIAPEEVAVVGPNGIVWKCDLSA